MNVKLYDSELRVMEVFWKSGDMQAARVCEVLQKQIGWNPNTTYTVIKKCITKGYLERKNPGFWCHCLITREEVQREETVNLIARMFGGSAKQFLQAFMEEGDILTPEELAELKKMIENK